jgi:deoxyadenosine/deoxycytidine kinase
MKIVISGTVGVGKSTLSKNLYQYYKDQGRDVVLINEIDSTFNFLNYYYDNMPE